MVQNIKNKYLRLFKTVKLQVSTTQQVRDEIITNITRKKQELLDKKAANLAVGIITLYKKQLDQKKE